MDLEAQGNDVPFENPCCDCKESGMSTNCRCKEKKRYDCAVILRDGGMSEEIVQQWLEQAGIIDDLR